MASTAKAQPSAKLAPPVSANAADRGQAAVAAMREERTRFDWSKTLFRPPGTPSALPAGLKSTLA